MLIDNEENQPSPVFEDINLGNETLNATLLALGILKLWIAII